jgi:hypothetical protein
MSPAEFGPPLWITPPPVRVSSLLPRVDRARTAGPSSSTREDQQCLSRTHTRSWRSPVHHPMA